MPSQATSAAPTHAPWATVAMMAALAPASRPSTSAAGSASAYPRLWASLRASS